MFFDLSKWFKLIWDQLWFILTLRPHGSKLPPSLPGKVPVIGNAYEVVGDGEKFWNLLQKWAKNSLKHGTVLVHLGPKILFVISDPEDALTVANNYFDKPYVYDFAKPWLGDGLITANGAIWKPNRKALAPAFNASMLHDFMPIFNDTARKFTDRMSEKVNKGPFDPWNMIVQSLLGNICQTLFGLKSEDKLVNKYSHGAEKFLNMVCLRFYRVWLHVPIIYKYSFLKRSIDKMCSYMFALADEIISKRKILRQKIKDNPHLIDTERFKSLLDYLLDTNENRNIFVGDEIRAQLDTMTAAAYDTTGAIMSFLLTVIGTYPEVQKRIRMELTDILENSTSDVDKQDLAKLVYLEAVIKECLRLYPPVPLTLRCSDEEVKLKNYTLPAKSLLGICILAINRHPMWGEDADQFRPERWLEPDGLPENSNAFCSFSLGKRNCLGKYYAMMFMKVMLAHLFRRYRVTGDIKKAVLKWDVTLRLLSGHEITVEEIES